MACTLQIGKFTLSEHLMSFIEILFLAIGLAMDCFAVSIMCGFIMKKFQFWPSLRLAFLFGLFQAGMPYIGWYLGEKFYRIICQYDHWIAFGILAILGGKMIYDEFKPENENENDSKINPYKWSVVLSLAVATSIDALSVGLSLSALNVSLRSCIPTIGITSFVLSWAGILLAVRFGKKLHIKAELIGGIILIAIGIKILVEHLLA